jgi:GxxExxY protein
MQIDEGDARSLQPVTQRIIGCAFWVADTLDRGFVEKIYEKALAHDIRNCPLGAPQRRCIVTCHDDAIVGEFTADLPVEDQAIVEPKPVIAPATCTSHNAATTCGLQPGRCARR